ncbi:MAG: hypothetical protein COV44_00895 [Deltaproteobacteria bacterium CG11_big_fil_rev_8_21_14_0_20_45_16]|nr:MAG: hypothetical protein COV44_00895 [Deltaproteobacteria bacterium CG11_big_fil_rev_8_21_14_0_20_45_16]
MKRLFAAGLLLISSLSTTGTIAQDDPKDHLGDLVCSAWVLAQGTDVETYLNSGKDIGLIIKSSELKNLSVWKKYTAEDFKENPKFDGKVEVLIDFINLNMDDLPINVQVFGPEMMNIRLSYSTNSLQRESNSLISLYSPGILELSVDSPDLQRVGVTCLFGGAKEKMD